jgi:integrase
MADLYQRPDSKVFYARIRVGGKLRRISTNKTSRREAQKAADVKEERLNLLNYSDKDIRLVAATSRFFKTKRLRPRTVQEYTYNLGNIHRILGDFPLKTLDVDQLRHYVTERQKEGVTVGLRRDLAFLSSLYTTARGWTDGPPSNPVKEYEKDAIPNAKKKTRFLTDAEFARLLAAFKWDYHRNFVVLAVFTGMRASEILRLTWDLVDLEKSEIVLTPQITKRDYSRVVPIVPMVRDTLARTPVAERQGVVIRRNLGDGPIGSMRKAFGTARRKAGLPDVTIHTMRHTFASWSRSKKVDPRVVQSIMGHKTGSMTDRYTHVTEDDVKSVAAAFTPTQKRTQEHQILGSMEWKGVKISLDFQGLGWYRHPGLNGGPPDPQSEAGKGENRQDPVKSLGRSRRE